MRLATLLLITMTVPAFGPLPAQSPPSPGLIGRWDLTVTGTRGSAPSWLEVRRSGNRMLVGRFVGAAGSARPISRIDFTGAHLHFALPPQWDRGDHDLVFDGELAGDRLAGSMTDAVGNRSTWVGVRAPALRRTSAAQWGKPLRLFNGRDFTGWHALGTNQWRVVGGVLTNPTAGSNLVTDSMFNDFKLHIEFRYAKGGNSGVYLRGRYEVQIEDSAPDESPAEGLAAVYGFLPPNQDASKGPGAWQAYDITLIGRRVTVVLNGRTVICDAEIPGITGGALSSDEGAAGPLLLQGDHEAIEYRNIVLTPAK